MVCILHRNNDVRPKMRFCLSPSPPKAIFSSTLISGYRCGSDHFSLPLNVQHHNQNCSNNNNYNNIVNNKISMQRQEDIINLNAAKIDEETSSDYKQWLHAMKLVARLPGGIPPEFRRKLWLSLADKYLKSKNVDWSKEEEKCFCDKWREDDEELGIQIVKDLHRTGSTLCTGPAGDTNQAKLKKILLGYARYNPEVGYCQGFNMLGALILQVMDKEESESIKVMIYLVEGILPSGYFCGSMGGLQADMAVFRDLMQTKLPRLAKHLQKLQGPVENAYEPPLTNVFTMQWFLTMFCTCLPMSCVLRVWDLVLIEGSDVLLRTALVLWSLLEEKVLSARTADEFYGKMGSFSTELLNGHLIDSNGLIEKVVQLGPITDIQKLRDKHLKNIAPLRTQQGLQLYFDEEEADIDEDSRLAVATVWGIPWGRRGSQGQSNNLVAKQVVESKDKIALDISLLKKQYDRLRERQKQAHIILTTACSTTRQGGSSNILVTPLPVNQLLSGRSAIITKKGQRSRPPAGAVPPARKPSLPVVLQEKPLSKQLRRGETIHWPDTDDPKRRRDSLTWKEIKAERAAIITSESFDGLKCQKIRTRRLGKSDSSSYSEESDDNNVVKDDGSSSDTSLCDDEFQLPKYELKRNVNAEKNKKSSLKNGVKHRRLSTNQKENMEKIRPRSWAPSNSDIPFVLMSTDSPNNIADEICSYSELPKIEQNDNVHLDRHESNNFQWKDSIFYPSTENEADSKFKQSIKTDSESIEDLSTILKQPITMEMSTKEPILTAMNLQDKEKSNKCELNSFNVSEEGVTNEYFERVNNSERPNRLDLLYSLNEEESIHNAFETENVEGLVEAATLSNQFTDHKSTCYTKNSRCMDLLVDYSEKSSTKCIEEAKSEISTSFQNSNVLTPILLNTETNIASNLILRKPKGSAEKRRDPRRLTLTRSSTMDIEKRYQALEKRLSMDSCSQYKTLYGEKELHNDTTKDLTQHIDLSNDNEIPSTAELEERFKKIELALNRDRNAIPLYDSEIGEKQKNNNKMPNANVESTISESLDGKNVLQKNGKNSSSSNDNEKEVDGQRTTVAPSDDKSRTLTINKVFDSETSKNCSISGSQSDPSGSNTIILKSSERKSKKKPPDDMENDEHIHETTNETISQSTVTNMSITDQKTFRASPSDDSEPMETNFNSSKDQNHNITKIVNVNVSKDERESSKSPSTKTTNRKKSPPSIEELERRFSALESQMMCTQGESSGGLDDFEQEKQTQPIEQNKLNSTVQTNDRNISNASTTLDVQRDLLKSGQVLETSAKRRLSEPPSTEDLEKRYEVLKRRMSSRNFETTSSYKEHNFHDHDKLHKTQTETKLPTETKKQENALPSSSNQSPRLIENLEECFEEHNSKNKSKNTTNEHSRSSTENFKKALEETPLSSSRHSLPSIETLEERFDKLDNKNEVKQTLAKQSPPSTENLEKRFENLQNQNKKCETIHLIDNAETLPSNDATSQVHSNDLEIMKANENDKAVASISEQQMHTFSNSLVKNLDHTKSSENTKANSNTLKDRPIKLRLIEELQTRIKENAIYFPEAKNDVESNVQKKLAVIEELKKKVKPINDEFVKPSKVPDRRGPTQSSLLTSLSFNDETLESHAASAYHRSGKYEPLKSPNRKAVRRFSDLPSRADLENRLQFLEEQLSKTVGRQRRSSDSEVSSKSRPKVNASRVNSPLSINLEHRVRELEKRLKDPRTFSMDVECANTKEKLINEPEIEVSQIELASDSVDITGKELVRYSSCGEVEDIERQNPINISINIQMTLNKDEISNKNNIEIAKTEELDRRLKLLEEQLKTSKLHTSEICAQPRLTGNASNTNIDSPFREQPEVPEKQIFIEGEKTSEKKDKDNIKGESNILCSDLPTDKDPEIAEPEQKETTINENILIMKYIDNERDNKRNEDLKQEIEIEKSVSIQKPIKNQCKENKESLKSEEKNSFEKAKIVEMVHDENIKELDKMQEVSTHDVSEIECEMNRPNANQSGTRDNADNDHQKSSSNQESNFVEEKLTDKDHTIQNNNDSIVGEIEIDAATETAVVANQDQGEIQVQQNIPKDNLSDESTQFVPVEINKKTLVLLLDNEPKAVKVRRLTRANTEELEDLFQALEKQLNNRGDQNKNNKNKEKNNSDVTPDQKSTEASKAMSDLAKEIESFTKSESNKKQDDDRAIIVQSKKPKHEEEFDWGSDPIKFHLKRKTVYLPSTKELEARFRSLERQIKLLEDVEKIDVEQRLLEIERKIKLQYSLSHEKDLNKFLELCEGKGMDDTSSPLEKQSQQCECCKNKLNTIRQPFPQQQTEQSHSADNLKYQHLARDLSKSKQNLKKHPIHPLEMLLDPSPDDSEIPTTGELEHRIRVMEEKHRTPSPSSQKSRSQSPSARNLLSKTKSNTHILESMTASPPGRELPTAEELEARLEALEKEQCFNYKMQKNFQQFNQKLKDAVSPSVSFDEFKIPSKSTISEAKETIKQNYESSTGGATKTIRFQDIENSGEAVKMKSSEALQQAVKPSQQLSTAHEGLGVMGVRLMRETSPLRRKGTHTGVPLRTGENINDQLTSIKNTIKSIDTLCEEKPYRKEKCQQYIDALFSDSSYFAHKKSSMEDLTSRNLSRSRSREIAGPSIRISDHSPTLTRSIGSAESIQSSSPLRSSSPLQYRSNRELRREPSPRRRRTDDREEHESRVRRDLLPNIIDYDNSTLSHTSHSSLTKFHKVDSQLIPNDDKYAETYPHRILLSPIDNTLDYDSNINTSSTIIKATTVDPLKIYPTIDKPISPYRLTGLPSNTNTLVYTPAKLAIRHTTVTSTFYDRVMTEKQLEKEHQLQQQEHFQLSNNRSPMTSPLPESHTNKNIPTDSANTVIFSQTFTGN